MRATLLMFLMLTSACYGGLVLEEYMNDNNISQRTNVLGGPGNIFLQNHRVTIRVDATNIALNCVVVSSSTQNTTNTPYKSVNGNTNADVMKTNRWESRQKNNGGSLQEWIMFDLGATKSFNYFKIWWEGAYATSYAFQVSDDKINWTTVYTNGAGGGGTEEQHFSMATGRYVKMLSLKKVNDNFGYSF